MDDTEGRGTLKEKGGTGGGGADGRGKQRRAIQTQVKINTLSHCQFISN